MNAHVLQFFYRFGAVFLDNVGYSDNPYKVTVTAEEQRGFPCLGKFCGFLFCSIRDLRFSADECQIASCQLLRLPGPGQAVARYRLKITDLLLFHFPFLCQNQDSLGQWMFALLLQR